MAVSGLIRTTVLDFSFLGGLRVLDMEVSGESLDLEVCLGSSDFLLGSGMMPGFDFPFVSDFTRARIPVVSYSTSVGSKYLFSSSPSAITKFQCLEKLDLLRTHVRYFDACAVT